MRVIGYSTHRQRTGHPVGGAAGCVDFTWKILAIVLSAQAVTAKWTSGKCLQEPDSLCHPPLCIAAIGPRGGCAIQLFWPMDTTAGFPPSIIPVGSAAA